MKVYDAAAIRNVAVVGHSGAGKTQLISALLVDAGAVSRFGKVDEGTTVTDYDDEAIARKHTLSASLAHLEWKKFKINLIDTPGFGNFFADARAAIRVADSAVLVVDAVAGILWIAIAFSGTLALGRTFERERYGETLKALLMAPAPRPAISSSWTRQRPCWRRPG